MSKAPKAEKPACPICGCQLTLGPGYANPTPEGRAHRTKHHHVPERFFGRSKNRRGTLRQGVFSERTNPWKQEATKWSYFCYECHEELLHNPVLLKEDIELFAKLARRMKLTETKKLKNDRKKVGKRIELFHKVIRAGLEALAL